MNIPEKCVNCPYINTLEARIESGETEIQDTLSSGFDTLDAQKQDKIEALAEAIIIDRITEIKKIQSGHPLIPRNQSAPTRHLAEITDIQTKRKVYSRYMSMTNGIFDIEDDSIDEETIRAAYEIIDTDTFLQMLNEKKETSDQLDDARNQHRDKSLELIDATQAVIDHSELRIEQAVESCENGARIRKRYVLFGRDVIKCGSQLGYVRGYYSEITDSPEQ